MEPGSRKSVKWLSLCAFAFGGLPIQAQDTISTAPGTVVRWSGPGTARCTMKGRSWAPIKGTCYYPVDLEERPGTRIPVARAYAGRTQSGYIVVEAFDYGNEDVALPDIPQANPSPADLERDKRDRARLSKIFTSPEGDPRFTLPLGPPAVPLPAGKSFGVTRAFNGKPASQPHMGIDYPTPVGSPVIAVANGTVALADDLFFEGKAVFIDHGDGLISMYFHLADIGVQAGQEVKKGGLLGHVGSTGRATGPHLFFGIRWHDARTNPKFVLEDPTRIPSLPSRDRKGAGADYLFSPPF
jgi:murein DD-endopeptidase MepM/ murein hydrolase activator NlpD